MRGKRIGGLLVRKATEVQRKQGKGVNGRGWYILEAKGGAGGM